VIKFRKIVLITLSIIVGLVATAIIAARILEPAIKKAVVEQINQQLSVPISVGEIEFSLIKKFPFASLEFQDVVTAGSKLDGVTENLLEAKKVFLLFNIFDAFSDDLKLKQINIESAKLNMYSRHDGRDNFSIFKDKSNDTSHFNVQLEAVKLIDVNFHLVQLEGTREYKINTKELLLKGAFSNNNYDLKINGSIFSEQFDVNKINYLKGKELVVDASINIDSKKKSYTFKKSTIAIAENKFLVDGYFQNNPNSVYSNITIVGEESNFKSLLSLIPGVYLKKLDEYKYAGDVIFSLRILGESSETLIPTISINFSAANASISPKSSNYSLSNIRLKGTYINRISTKNPVELLQINDLTAMLENQKLSANLRVENFNNPYINLKLKSNINLEVLKSFYIPDTIETITGNLFVDANIQGNTKDKNSWVSYGSLVADNVNFKLKNKEIDFHDFNGKFELEAGNLSVSNFTGNIAGSDFKINGKFDNVYQFLLTRDAVIRGEASINSRNIDFNELLEDKSKTNTTDTTYRLDFSPRIDLSITVNAGIISFRKFQAWQLKGKVELQDKVLKASKLSFKACEGTIVLDGRIDANPTNNLIITCDAQTNNINIQQLFADLGNFGQTILVDKNVKGNLNSSTQFSSVWTKSLNCDFDKVVAVSDLTINNGELNNFEPMKALSKYLKGSDLNSIKFSTLHNIINIKNQQIYFPTMQIKSSVLDLTASGTHSFNNQIDYKLQLLLSDLIGNKIKKNNTEFGVIEDDGLGKMKIFLSMRGLASNPKITYDKKAVEEKISKDIAIEKQTIKDLLNKEFSVKKGEGEGEKTQEQTKPKRQELELDTEE
jgi:hypothetical protein